MSACLHRYFAHRGFTCNRFVQFLLYLGGSLASQGSPIWWASMHRRHHAACDTDDDPHSPVVKGFMMAWLGWVYVPGTRGRWVRGRTDDSSGTCWRFRSWRSWKIYIWGCFRCPLRVLSARRHPVGALRERVVVDHLPAGHDVFQRRVPHAGVGGGQVPRGLPSARHSVRSIIEPHGRGLSSVAPPAPEGVPKAGPGPALLPLHPAYAEAGRVPREEPALKNLRSRRSSNAV